MSNNEDGFSLYEETTIDPGWSLILGSFVACVLLHATLPCLVTLGSRYENRRNRSRRRESERTTESDEIIADNSSSFITQSRNGQQMMNFQSTSFYHPSSTVAAANQQCTTIVEEPKKLTQRESSRAAAETAVEEEEKGENQVTRTTTIKRKTNNNMMVTEQMEDVKLQEDAGSRSSDDEAPPPPLPTSIFTVCLGTTIPEWFCDVADVLMISKRQPLNKEVASASKKRSSKTVKSVASSVLTHTTNASRNSSFGGRLSRRPQMFLDRLNRFGTSQDEQEQQQQMLLGKAAAKRHQQNQQQQQKRRRQEQQQQKIRKPIDATGTENAPIHTNGKKKSNNTTTHTSSSNGGSALSNLQHDDVSFTEAIDSYNQSRYQIPKNENGGTIDILFGEHAWWKPSMIIGAFDRIVGVADWDEESDAIFRLAVPFSVQSLATGLFNLADLALISHLIGTSEANIFVIVTAFTWMTTTLNYGFCEVLGKTVPNALAEENNKLAGKYLNTSISLFFIGMIPITVIWSFSTNRVFLWLGFDSSVATLGQDFAYLQLMLELVTGIDYCLHLFLDVTGHEKYSTWTMVIFNSGRTLGVGLALLAGKNDLLWVGCCRVLFSSFLLFVNGCAVLYQGWMEPYSAGILVLPLSDTEIVQTVTKGALPLGLSYFLTYGEWELLTLLASPLGPAEVVAWAMTGYVWSIMKYISDGIADAAEVRCAIHLVSNEPDLAHLSAYKSLFIGTVSSWFVCSLLFILGEPLAWLATPDSTLQRMMVEIFPLIGMGHIVLTVGMISWALLGAQGRYQEATLVQFVCSWGVTLPLGALFTYGLQIDLQGLTCAFVLGLALSGTGNTYLLIRSQWELLAATIAEESRFVEEGNNNRALHPEPEKDNVEGRRGSQQPSVTEKIYRDNVSSFSEEFSLDSSSKSGASF